MSATLPPREPIPEALRARDQWICWREQDREGKPTKVPVEPADGSYASATDAGTWTSFDTAHEYAQTADVAGLGYVFTDTGPYVGVDLDDCRDPETGDVADWAATIIETLESFTEISPSGTGFHVLVEGSLPEGRNRKGNVEMYETARFFTVTGDIYRDRGIEQREEKLVAVHAEHVAGAPTDTTRQSSVDEHTATETADNQTLSDEALLTRAREAKNGEKFTRLWCGDTRGYDSQSEADMALCTLLAFWTGGNATRMDRLFRDSDLMREKWDTQHFADGSTYGEKTIQRAISHVDEFYDPDTGRDDSPRESGNDSRQAESGQVDGTGTASRRDSSPPTPATTTDAAPTSDPSTETNDRAVAARVETLELKVQRLQSALEEEREDRRALEERVANLEALLDSAATETAADEDSLVDRLGSLFE